MRCGAMRKDHQFIFLDLFRTRVEALRSPSLLVVIIEGVRADLNGLVSRGASMFHVFQSRVAIVLIIIGAFFFSSFRSVLCTVSIVTKREIIIIFE